MNKTAYPGLTRRRRRAGTSRWCSALDVRALRRAVISGARAYGTLEDQSDFTHNHVGRDRHGRLDRARGSLSVVGPAESSGADGPIRRHRSPDAFCSKSGLSAVFGARGDLAAGPVRHRRGNAANSPAVSGTAAGGGRASPGRSASGSAAAIESEVRPSPVRTGPFCLGGIRPADGQSKRLRGLCERRRKLAHDARLVGDGPAAMRAEGPAASLSRDLDRAVGRGRSPAPTRHRQ